MQGIEEVWRGRLACAQPWALAILLIGSSAVTGHGATLDELLEAVGLERAQAVVHAPEFVLNDLAGKPVSGKEFQGKVLLLTFWASHCAVCVEILPSVERLYQRFKDEGFAAVAISIDAQGVKAAQPVAEKHGWSFPVLVDPQFETIRKFGTRLIPASYLIDQKGTVISSLLVPRDWDSDEDFALVKFLVTHPPTR